MSRVVLATHDVVGTILDVQAVPTKSGKVKYDVAFSDGKKYTTFRQEIATAAANLKGQQGITLRVETSQNGQYTNHDLVEVGPMTPLPAQPTALPGGVQQFVQPNGGGLPEGITMAPQRDFEKEARGKVRHGAIVAGLEAAARTTLGEDDQSLFLRAVNFAKAIEQHVFQDAPVAAVVEAPAPEPVTVESLVEAGTVQVGTSGLPWVTRRGGNSPGGHVGAALEPVVR